MHPNPPPPPPPFDIDAAGCAGWGSDQLRGECDMHSWFVSTGGHVRDVAMSRIPLSPATDCAAAGMSGHGAWRAAMRGMGGEFAAFAAVGDYTRLLHRYKADYDDGDDDDGDDDDDDGSGRGGKLLSEDLHDLSVYGVDAEP